VFDAKIEGLTKGGCCLPICVAKIKGKYFVANIATGAQIMTRGYFSAKIMAKIFVKKYFCAKIVAKIKFVNFGAQIVANLGFVANIAVRILFRLKCGFRFLT
jgi:CRISPR/Cas system-associated protein Csx1